MSDIIERLEKATASEQFEMLELAFFAVHGQKPPRVHGGSDELTAWLDLHNPFHKMLQANAFESAAMSLVPEGWRMVGMSECERGGWYASAFPRDPDAMGIPRTFDAHSATLARGEAPTPALALCIAALKARASSVVLTGDGRLVRCE